ncbi:MAG TPA: cytidine deaminase [Pyrinomonadaceae bacterium]|nr:cytidine deaminase [Pyrinomonadaceae bacterium]
MSKTKLPPVTGGAIPAAEVAQFLRSSGMTIDELMLALIPEAQKFALPPISNFFVGAVALGTSGSLYFGANFEFVGQALSFTVHGEQAATAHAISRGEIGMQMLAVSAAPCGYCRQFLYELTTASTLLILLPKTPPTLLTSLIPDAFGPGDLKVTAALMSPQSHGMTLSSGADDPAVQAALKAANASYAPYTFDYSGVALKTRDGGIYTGSVAEDAAFNPSMSPLEAAVVSLVISGGKSYKDIVDAVLVEMADSKAGQAAATSAALEAITPVPLRVYQAQPSSRDKKKKKK